MSKMRAFVELWDELLVERYGVENEKYRRFRYGVQVNSLGLTESQPENNAWRILIEALGVTLSRKARCRALQLPAWNEAMSLPRPWDQQWSLRLQQILAYETDLLEYPDLFDGSPVIESKVAELKASARAEIDRIMEMGGVIPAIESGYMKSASWCARCPSASAASTTASR
jgi:ethylmalonyl-CoA mutase